MPCKRSLLFVLCGLLAVHAGAQGFRDRFTAVTPQNFDSGGAVSRQFHLHTAAYRYQATVHRTAAPRPLPEASLEGLAALPVVHSGNSSTFSAYVAGDALLDGVIVLHRGAIAFEAYPHMAPWERHFAWSVSKVLTATTLAALVREGRVAMAAPVERYLPVLAGTAWAGTPLQAVAAMGSGIDCLDSDGYQDSSTCIYRLEEALDITAPTGRKSSLPAELRAMARRGPPGARNEYVSANTAVLGLVIEAVTGKPFAEVVQAQLWARLGPEADALIAISSDGYPYAAGGFSLRLRDLARFGELFTVPEHFGAIDSGLVEAIQKEGIALEAEDLDELRATLGDDLPRHSSWQWDYVWGDGAFFKSGYDGQGLYVDPARELVIAWFGTGLDFSESVNGMLPVARQLANSGLFDHHGTPLDAVDSSASGDGQPVAPGAPEQEKTP
ncbi:serine hydrolase domain-containing protein [Pseudohaliea rubra]|uniref:6-aminohexanoate-dimer hydrolase n=1 Tax=Pseudohaliea rubra DSM 19751 TaxID=1265313 RepID=A0A095VUC7_9GAMM|nr:serine hydrolase domain-containing protein [Pseudohaliea rubra]KGE04638.1 6-aminohexanoate-dimer hydrolase [Pseudohaliea rubra DSM 19751]